MKTLLLTLLLTCCCSLCPAEDEEELSPKHKVISYVLKQEDSGPILEALDDEEIQELSVIKRWNILTDLYAYSKHPAIIQALIDKDHAPLIKEGERETHQEAIEEECYSSPLESIIRNSSLSVEQRIQFLEQLLAKGEVITPMAFYVACHSGEKELIALCLKDKALLKYSLHHLCYLNPHSLLQDLEADASEEERAEAIQYQESTEVKLKESFAYLLEQGADINQKDDSECSLSDNILFAENACMLKLLIEQGLDVEALDDEKNSLLHLACIYSCGIEITDLLLQQGLDINARNNHGQTPLLMASEGGNSQIIPFLVEQGADITAVDSDCNTILHNARWEEEPNFDVLALALEKGVDIDALEDESEATALMLACLNNNLKLASCLLEKGANVKLSDSTGFTAMHYACLDEEMNPSDIIKMLVKHGADINALDVQHMTPLMLSCNLDNMPAVRALVEQGADVNLRADNCSALDYAIYGMFLTQNKEIFCYIAQHQSWLCILSSFAPYIYLLGIIILCPVMLIIIMVQRRKKKQS